MRHDGKFHAVVFSLDSNSLGYKYINRKTKQEPKYKNTSDSTNQDIFDGEIRKRYCYFVIHDRVILRNTIINFLSAIRESALKYNTPVLSYK